MLISENSLEHLKFSYFHSTYQSYRLNKGVFPMTSRHRTISLFTRPQFSIF